MASFNSFLEFSTVFKGILEYLLWAWNFLSSTSYAYGRISSNLVLNTLTAFPMWLASIPMAIYFGINTPNDYNVPYMY